MRTHLLSLTIVLFLSSGDAQPTPRTQADWTDPAKHKVSSVLSNGAHLNVLDWGGDGPALIFVHGLAENPHAFDDLAAELCDHYRVIAYARRGHGLSDTTGPYDIRTLTEDLKGLLDALHISKAHLAGWSMGGNEITSMASMYPKRVDRLIYLDAAYDWSDSVFVEAFGAYPASTPEERLSSLDRYREYLAATYQYPTGTPVPYEAYLRQQVAVNADGTVQPRMEGRVVGLFVTELLTTHRDYQQVRAPLLAIYATNMIAVDVADSAQRAANMLWEKQYIDAFRAASIKRVQAEVPEAIIVTVPGTHNNFFYVSKRRVAELIRQFLSDGKP